MAAFKNSGTAIAGTSVPVADPKAITVKAGAAAARLKLFSVSAAGTLEFDIECPAHDTKFLVRGALADRFPVGQPLFATITGDADTFVRIDD